MMTYDMWMHRCLCGQSHCKERCEQVPFTHAPYKERPLDLQQAFIAAVARRRGGKPSTLLSGCTSSNAFAATGMCQGASASARTLL